MKMNEPLEFRLDSIHVDGYEHSNMLDVTLGDMKSGETRQILINFSAQNQVILKIIIIYNLLFLGWLFAQSEFYMCF